MLIKQDHSNGFGNSFIITGLTKGKLLAMQNAFETLPSLTSVQRDIYIALNQFLTDDDKPTAESAVKKHLTLSNQHKFFNSLKSGEVFTYSESFIASEVISKAAEIGVDVEYCVPGTPQYKKFGCYTCQVL